MDNLTFVLDGYFTNMVTDIIMVAETGGCELAPIDVINIAVYTLHSLATSGDSTEKINDAATVKATLNSIIGDDIIIAEFMEVMKDAIESGSGEKMDIAFKNYGIKDLFSATGGDVGE